MSTGGTGSGPTRLLCAALITVLCAAAFFLWADGPRPASTAGGQARSSGAREGAAPEGHGRPCERTLVGVAHPDDDLLFINPEIQRLIRSECFVTVVYLTAGDSGSSFRRAPYARGRESGVLNAYAKMANVRDSWRQEVILAGGHPVLSYTLNGGPDIRLTFLRLPDGMPRGRGTSQYSHQSLLRIFRGRIHRIGPVDGTAAYTEPELLGTLSALMSRAGVGRVLTLDYDNVSFGGFRTAAAGHYDDHSDHGIAARYFRKAAFATPLHPAVVPYLGYGISFLPDNLDRIQERDKGAVFQAYLEKCRRRKCPTIHTIGPSFRKWIRRQYARSHRTPHPGEILSAIGEATSAGSVERCLDSARGREGKAEVVACDGSADQSWRFSAGTITSAAHGLCLTAAREITLSACVGSPDQMWWRDTDGRVGSGGRCLSQDDPARSRPRLRLGPCAPYQPEQRWYW
ncbi:ricin-type beta-trefoil lectin domain protein [Streptomyces sp. NPDC002138]|uniref:ricin-type beta-trefoil lectin domain protein n=1 Tax=Streptomyces sp. NPDC002138 TaxID=3154410 RepID=UPI00331C23D2